jgi:Zn-dependent protease with chaperone function
MQGSTRGLAAQYFDGVSARALPANVAVEGAELRIGLGEQADRRMPLKQVQWPERQRHGARVAHLPDGAALHFDDAAAFDDWANRSGIRESWVVGAQQSWRWTLIGAALLVLVCGALYQWGLPWGARAVLAFVPGTVDKEIGDTAMRSIREQWLKPSELPIEKQKSVREAWARAVDRYGQPGMQIDLHFHKSRIGPNAFALPGGDVVLTDEMVKLVDGREDILVGVLAHEAGHVRHRHTMRLLTQATLLGAGTAIAFGDFSTLLAAAPALLGHLGYSRDLEREADEEAIALLKANGLSPALMATMFENLRKYQREKNAPSLPIAFGSHPSDEERVARFRAAADGR